MEQCSYQLSRVTKNMHTFPATQSLAQCKVYFLLLLYTHYRVVNFLGHRLLFPKFQTKVKKFAEGDASDVVKKLTLPLGLMPRSITLSYS